jgi:uncharacterized protein (TIGR03084 family)
VLTATYGAAARSSAGRALVEPSVKRAISVRGVEIFDDLEAEEDRLEAILDGFDDAAWVAPSGAAGWTVADVVVHLAQSEEAVVASAAGRLFPPRSGELDAAMDRAVRAEAAPPEVVFQRWRTARRTALAALRDADPDRRLPWAATPLRPKALATTRLAEHWAHGLDITGPSGIPFPDTDRLRHVAWLAHRSLPYALSIAGAEAHEVFCELVAPDGTTWRFGPADAPSTISGPAGAFCRVGARRLAPEASGLVALGPHGPTALRVLRNYAA